MYVCVCRFFLGFGLYIREANGYNRRKLPKTNKCVGVKWMKMCVCVWESFIVCIMFVFFPFHFSSSLGIYIYIYQVICYFWHENRDAGKWPILQRIEYSEIAIECERVSERAIERATDVYERKNHQVRVENTLILSSKFVDQMIWVMPLSDRFICISFYFRTVWCSPLIGADSEQISFTI